MKTEFDTIKKTIDVTIQSINDTVVNKTTQITTDIIAPNGTTDGELILEYIKVLLWPSIIFILIIFFREKIIALFDKILQSGEISTPLLSFKDKLRDDMIKLVDESTDSETRSAINSKIKQSYIDEFRIYSSYFFTKPLNVRNQAASEIFTLVQNLDIDDIIPFASSPLAGERVGAFIGIKSKLINFPNLAQDEKITDAIQNGLGDKLSRVRFRVVQAIASSKDLSNLFKPELKKRLTVENNKVVKNEIIRSLID